MAQQQQRQQLRQRLPSTLCKAGIMSIILFHPKGSETIIDEAGFAVNKRVLPPPCYPGPYCEPLPPSASPLPSLTSLCLRLIAQFPDDVHMLPFRLNYRPELGLPASLPCLARLHPLLWITLAQVYDGLPDCLATYSIPLSDQHIPLLQRVPHTPLFSLLTILDLPACPELTDDSIYVLKSLHSLVAFDASATVISPYAIKVLARSLVHMEQDSKRNGPWTLRILRLRNCRNIDDSVHSYFCSFPLLSVIGKFYRFSVLVY